jgi:hypothetical protein
MPSLFIHVNEDRRRTSYVSSLSNLLTSLRFGEGEGEDEACASLRSIGSARGERRELCCIGKKLY